MSIKVTTFINTQLAKSDSIVRELNEKKNDLIKEILNIDARIADAQLEITDLTSDKEKIETVKGVDEVATPII